jgi:thioredoxin
MLILKQLLLNKQEDYIMSALQVTVENFEQEVLKSEVPVIVDFWASWCGPCQALLPVIEELAGEADGFKVVKVNIDDSAELAKKYRVMSVPTLIVFKNGEAVKRSVGVIPKDEIIELVNA